MSIESRVKELIEEDAYKIACERDVFDVYIEEALKNYDLECIETPRICSSSFTEFIY